MKFNFPGTCLTATAALALVSLASGPAAAQDAKKADAPLPAFDAVSVKPFQVPATGWTWGPPTTDPQRLSIPGSPLRTIILQAFGLDDYQLLGLPDWTSKEFFSISATTSAPTPPDQMLLMLRRMLAERFKLEYTLDEKAQPVYAIVAAPGGLKMKPRADGEVCPRGVSGADLKAAGAPPSAMSGFNGCTMDDLLKAFNRAGMKTQLGRPVIDKSGITGRYHMLVWQATEQDESYDGPGFRMSYVEPFREAVEKELGLKLIEDTANIKFMTVTSVSRPSGD